jgi:hypothetical protein
MPAKKHTITDEERARRIRETAREFGTSNSPEDFERALDKIVRKPATPSAASRPSQKNQ